MIVTATASPTPEQIERNRRATAAMTTRSWTEAPHFHLESDIDVTEAFARWRPTALVVALLRAAFVAHPEMNRRADDRTPTIDIGMLVATSSGLSLPCLADVETLDSMEEIESAISAAKDRAERGRLRPSDMIERTISISNLGMFPVDRILPVIPSPDTMVLAVGRTTTQLRHVDNGWTARQIMPLTLTMDHRYFDGADGGRLLRSLETSAANPETLL